MALSLYDSATRLQRPFEPLTAGHVGLYACGPTTQGGPHIGHLRTILAVDVLVRWLRRSGYDVTYVRNVTDIDDKILNLSAAHDARWWAWSYRFEREFAAVMGALNTITPTYEPRATGHVPQMIDLTRRIIDNGHAYAAGHGNVYFDVASFPEYGELTHQSIRDMQESDDGDAEGKRDPRDFALWKAPKPGEPADAAWETPWGRARPGWHLECSAMTRHYLGETFDIHAGGLDLRFPHHENERAQSLAAGYGFARSWMHCGVLTVDGLKMGKSLDNFVTAADALAQHPAPVIRLALTRTHYRSSVEYNAEAIAEMTTVWNRLVATSDRALETLGPAHALAAPGGALVRDHAAGLETDDVLGDVELPGEFTAAMDDDLGVSDAFAVIHRTAGELNTLLAASHPAADAVAALYGPLRAMLDVFGLDPLDPAWADAHGSDDTARSALDALVRDQLDQRARAREDRDWARADSIRDALGAAGITVEDSADGVRWNLKGMH